MSGSNPEAVRLYAIPTLSVTGAERDGRLSAARLPVHLQRLPDDTGQGRSILAAAALAQERGWEALATLAGDEHDDHATLHQFLAAARPAWPALIIGAPGNGRGPRGALLSRFLVRLACGESVPDTAGACRLYPVQFLSSCRFAAHGPGFLLETLVRGAWAGLPLCTVQLSGEHAPATDSGRTRRTARDTLELILLHARLLGRALLPWPHRRLIPKTPGTPPLRLLFQPLQVFRLLCREHASPGELAAAAWMGIFIGALPIIPFGIATIVYVHHKLHLNKLAGIVASNVCVFPFVPLLCVEVGHFIRFGRFWCEFNRQTLLHELHQRLWEWLLGALLVGPLMGCAGALVTYLLIRRLRYAPDTA